MTPKRCPTETGRALCLGGLDPLTGHSCYLHGACTVGGGSLLWLVTQLGVQKVNLRAHGHGLVASRWQCMPEVTRRLVARTTLADAKNRTVSDSRHRWCCLAQAECRSQWLFPGHCPSQVGSWSWILLGRGIVGHL